MGQTMSAMSANSCRGVGGRRVTDLENADMSGCASRGFKRAAGKRRVEFFSPSLSSFHGEYRTVPPLLVALDSSKIGKISHDRRNVSVLLEPNVPSFRSMGDTVYILFYERDIKPALLHLHRESR